MVPRQRRTCTSSIRKGRSFTKERLITAQHCEAWYYAGMKRLLAGDKKTAADYLNKCLGTREKNFDEYILAQAELKSLGATN